MDISEYIDDFKKEAAESLVKIAQAIETLKGDPSHAESIAVIHRLFHSLKSASAMMELNDISAICKDMEMKAAPYDGKGEPVLEEDLNVYTEAHKSVSEMLEKLVSES